MQKLKAFFQTFVKSLSQPSYYKNFLPTKFSSSLKYLAFLLFIISLFGALKFTFILIEAKPRLPEFVDKVKMVVTDIYPDKLVITLKDGKLSTNAKEPYFIDLPKGTWDMGTMHLIAIDTKGNVEDYGKYNSAIFLTSEFAVMPNNDNRGDRIYPLKDLLKDVPDGAFINKSIYQSFAIQVLPYVDNLPSYLSTLALILVVLWPFIAMSFALSGHMFYLVFFALILWIIAKMMKKNLSYGKIYQLSMHGLTLPILISGLISLFGKSIPFLYSIILLVFMIVVFKKLSNKIQQSN